MGHHLSKQTDAVVVAATNEVRTVKSKSNRHSRSRRSQRQSSSISSNGSSQTPTINLRIAQGQQPAVPVPVAAPATAKTVTTRRTAVEDQLEEEIENVSAEVQQIIIKIQLAKMENGNGLPTEQEVGEERQQQVLKVLQTGYNGAATSTSDALNANEQQIVNVTINTAAAVAGETNATGLLRGANIGGGGGAERTAGSSTEAATTRERLVNNNNLLRNAASAASATAPSAAAGGGKATAVNSVQLHDDESEMAATPAATLSRRRLSNASAEVVDYCEVVEPTTPAAPATPPSPAPVGEMLSNRAQRRAQSQSQSQTPSGGNTCCLLRKSGATGNAAAAEAAAASTALKRRCCKCRCRDVMRDLWRGMRQDSSSSSSGNNANASRQSSSSNRVEPTAVRNSSSSGSKEARKLRSTAEHHRRSTPANLMNGSGASSSSGSNAARHQIQKKRNSVAVPEASTAASSQLAIWAGPANGNVIIHISSPQIVVEPLTGGAAGCSVCTSPVVAVGRIKEASSIRLIQTAPTSNANEPCAAPVHNIAPYPIEQQQQQRASLSYGNGVTVHSQIDFMHCLVPDLERIINSSFYWGKMDRYEAERLLEGKPEGTFLLRDSAQEEFLFSVTFRKYGRSLHARIEQSGHKFSFDCHDPCVFTAPTVTGLLEHYKDPTCVMFFEPCLTIPLHRQQTFSLQQLARATIVSNTTYDGINQLELPGQLKAYLKEYHYKQKLRVKPCDANTPYYANI